MIEYTQGNIILCVLYEGNEGGNTGSECDYDDKEDYGYLKVKPWPVEDQGKFIHFL